MFLSSPAFVGLLTFLLQAAVVEGQSNFPPKRQLQGIDSYFDSPSLKWSIQLEGEGTIESGNSISVSPENTLVYVTSSEGRLDVLAASNGASRWSYTPEPVGLGWEVKCESGVYFGDRFGFGKYAIYAVIDVPPPSIAEDFQSRIIAVSHPDNELLWISDAIPGQIQGTPVISQSFSMRGEYIFFTHNVNFDLFGEDIVGSFSIVHAGGEGALLFSEVAGESPTDPAPETMRLGPLRVPYGPLGVAHDPLAGRYPGGEGNPNDLVAWGVSLNGGRATQGYTRAFQLPGLFQPEFAGNLMTTFLREVRWNVAAAPAFTSNGFNVVFGVNPNALRAWTGLNGFDANANVVVTLEQDPNDGRASIPKPPVISLDDERVFVFGTTPFLYGLNAESGSTLWNTESDALFTGTVNVSPDNVLVFATQENGRVSARQQSNGSLLWEITCANLDDIEGTSCADDLQGDFSISPNGLVMYYGDRTGNVKALQIGESPVTTNPPTEFPTRTPTMAPTNAPVTGLPSAPPSGNPTIEGQTPSPTAEATPSPTMESIPETNERGDPQMASTSGTRGLYLSTVAVVGALLSLVLAM